ncbi:MAG: hypothetical protein CMJ36_01040 [Phycisphaerae bacterium]|nr:hypothetical protein [Phycisphaerae bacterium]
MPLIRCSLLALACLLLAGCSSQRSSSLQPAIQEYDAGHLSLARLKARRVLQRDDADSYEAAWIMGLCSQRLGDNAAALESFEVASGSPEPLLAARARAMAGQCLVNAGQPAVAAVQFERAWDELQGEDRRQCAEHAVNAWREAGREDRARLWAARVDDTGNPGPRPRASTEALESQSSGRFTLQAGAYRDEGGARRACDDLLRSARNAGVSTPVVRTRMDRHGATLYLVHVGSFTSRNHAAMARREFESMDMIVVAH